MAAPLRKPFQRGFTLIELVSVIAIVAILATVLLSRVLIYQEQAEKVAMEQLVGTVRSALHLQIASLLLKGNVADMEHLVDQNPMNWLADKPTNYVGEYYLPQQGLIAPGHWYFDMHDKTLIYLANNQAHLQTAPGELNKIRFQVKRITSPSNNSKTSASVENSNGGSLEGMVLEPAKPYSWF
jgi:prepilin-type N-terminal cleavage/methylation domain-containing protein